MIDVEVFRRAMQHSPASVVITDAEGIIEYVNPKFESVSGYAAAEVLGGKPSLLKSGLQPDAFYADLWRTITAGEDWHGEFGNRTKAGEIYWERASISPVRSEDGVITHFVAVKEDITAERQAAAAARRHHERFELAMRGANDGVWDWDFTTNAVFYSPRWVSMLGYETGEVEPHLSAFERLVHPADRDAAFHAVQAYLAGVADRYEIQLRMRHKAGHYVDILARGFAVRDTPDAAATRLVGTHLDISDHVRAEHRLRAQVAATHVLATATTLMETLPRLLSALGEAGLWTVGCVWAVDPTAERLRCLALWSASDMPAGAWSGAARAAAIRKGEGAAGQAWRSGDTTWIADEAVSCPGTLAEILGFRATFALPIAIGGRIVAVLQFCARDGRPRDDRWLQMLGTMYELAMHVIERRRVERALQAKTAGRPAIPVPCIGDSPQTDRGDSPAETGGSPDSHRRSAASQSFHDE